MPKRRATSVTSRNIFILQFTKPWIIINNESKRMTISIIIKEFEHEDAKIVL